MKMKIVKMNLKQEIPHYRMNQLVRFCFNYNLYQSINNKIYNLLE